MRIQGDGAAPPGTPLLNAGLVPYTIYGMEETTKTTVYLPTAAYRRLQVLAEAEGVSTAELLREAVREYAQKRTSMAQPRSIGALRVNRPDLSEQTKELLEGFGG